MINSCFLIYVALKLPQQTGNTLLVSSKSKGKYNQKILTIKIPISAELYLLLNTSGGIETTAGKP